ncbi:PucR family transcriptional regulator [Nonomuraea harbinensis]|uniref:PucR family transcriptional regulator n=1 Tax=Nonomuraea harbinensis TaxID=1286938 RepID=A0ABW1BY17_9ACTN|nr:PucR family transcriptional regulator ligand-binding domain-containing protein [Nonomuraea harbinensis]
MSVLDAISLPPLNVAEVLTGRSALAYRSVRWIQVMHWPSDEFVRPGDLVLSTGVAPSEQAAREFLENVVRSDAAALIVSLPEGLDQQAILAPVIPVARAREFPVLSLPWEVPFADVSRTIVTRLMAMGCYADESSCALRHAGVRRTPLKLNVSEEISRAMALRAESADVEVALGRPGAGADAHESLARLVAELQSTAAREQLQLRLCQRPGVALLVLEDGRGVMTLRRLLERARQSVSDTSTHWVVADRDGHEASHEAPELAQSMKVGREIMRDGDSWVASQPLESLFVLGAMAQNPLINSVVVDAVGPLVEYDRQNRRNLVETLQVFLDESCNTSAAARRLFLNRHSLMYRLTKIEELTGFSLKEPADRFFLHASVRLYRYRLVEGIAEE